MKKYFCLFLWISFFAINIKALEDDTRVGSRGMWVEKHLNGFLTLHLRKCLCSNNTAKVCLCWNNVDKQDQPAVQGSVVNILSSFLNYFDFSEVGFGFYTNQETNEQICKFPDQQMLVSLLKLAKIDHLFSLENSKLNYNKFLSLISVGKFPLAQVEDNYDSLKYHMYFHDVFNHMPIWLVLPVKYRNLVVNKVNNFLIFSQNKIGRAHV